MRYGRVSDMGMSANLFRVDAFLSAIDTQLGNGGFNKDIAEYLVDNRHLIEDAFMVDDSAYILPKTKEFAKELYHQCVHIEEGEDNTWAIADEVGWYKLGERYYLSLWWD